MNASGTSPKRHIFCRTWLRANAGMWMPESWWIKLTLKFMISLEGMSRSAFLDVAYQQAHSARTMAGGKFMSSFWIPERSDDAPEWHWEIFKQFEWPSPWWQALWVTCAAVHHFWVTFIRYTSFHRILVTSSSLIFNLTWSTFSAKIASLWVGHSTFFYTFSRLASRIVNKRERKW